MVIQIVDQLNTLIKVRYNYAAVGAQNGYETILFTDALGVFDVDR
jgi:hypothetical protein